MSRFFIDRPIFAWVIAIVIMLAGALALMRLPVEQYPGIAPPTVGISASYPGASAEAVADSVTQVIEQKMKGIDNLRSMRSTSDSVGNVSIILTFEPEADPDIAQVQVQNKLQLAMPLLPQEVQQQGVSVSKANDNFFMVAALVSQDGRISDLDLADYMVSNLQDDISRLPGVGEVTVFGAQHAMRIWLNPDKLSSYALAVTDITAAITAQNADVSAGQLGGTPAVRGQQINASIKAQSRLKTPEQFGNILLKVKTDGSQVRLKDVARIEIGSESYDSVARYNGKPAVGIALKLATGANALKTAEVVRKRFADLTPFMPAGVEVTYPYDTTPFVKISIEEVIKTLAEAIVLVFCVMYLFLQNLRATLIPTIAVPVVLLGTFGVLAAAGFSVNTLTMFAMVLAIGLLVDDAIVVVENVERVMSEEGLPPKEATRKSMGQITGALIGIALVLSAVFVPMAFFSGSTGAIYRQFSLTLVAAMALSVVVALVLSQQTLFQRRNGVQQARLTRWPQMGQPHTIHRQPDNFQFRRAVGAVMPGKTGLHPRQPLFPQHLIAQRRHSQCHRRTGDAKARIVKGQFDIGTGKAAIGRRIIGHQFIHAPVELIEHMIKGGLQQDLLAGKMVQQSAFGNTCRVGNRLQGNIGKPLANHQIQRAFQQGQTDGFGVFFTGVGSAHVALAGRERPKDTGWSVSFKRQSTPLPQSCQKDSPWKTAHSGVVGLSRNTT
ncbi:hydrophobe/amphiphile efflux-1 (HAE1) family protein [Insolitispirillum peregrinum]|uniref:Hydrophobe/amphiphile efflux-1 (HAE1) family protein n=1 Tax=Insolitispirillum peregrinum TaxID=80876 RepID=A0A1N7L179_9PROT|nr:efflux RND transporter permease subunit [Insolitispirillum peregrinum]SIS67506.1 hydrophobe/amphiphile efflux-1 (HAE1) family protein [Insolitispirillum peregrinum]